MFAVKCLLVAMAAGAANAFSLGPTDISFHLYSRNNPTLSQVILPTASSIMTANFFSPLRDTIITIHSHNDNAGGNANAFLVPALLTEDVNVLAVEWSAGGGMYSNGLGHAPQVGTVIADFINLLQNNFGYSPNRISIVGIGMGGHIAGIAARNVIGNVNIPKIVAIDPPLVGWTHHPGKLNADDADLVEVLHATAGHFGYDYPLGDIDFYANGGSAQTGCGNDVDCSHIYAYAFYAESLSPEGLQFVGTKCDSYEEAIALQCSGDERATFGGREDKTGVSGIYTFLTNPTSPFARG